MKQQMKNQDQQNNSFSTISYIKLRKINGETKDLYYGSSKELLNFTKFNEYGWKYIIQKDKLNNNPFIGEDPLDYLLDKTKKDIIGLQVDDIMKVRNTLFPTLSNEKLNEYSISYFSSIVINSQRLFMIMVPPEYIEASLFEYIPKTPDTTPNITITFDKNKSNYYKIIWFVITAGNKDNISDINLSYISWLDDPNPYRNLKNYLVPKTESLLIDVCEKINGEWVDKSSNTLLGNKKIEKPIIYNSFIDNAKNKFIKSNGIDILPWNKYVRFFKNQVVRFENNDWISLVDDNFGEIPTYSNNWILKDKLDLSKNRKYIKLLEEIDSDNSIENYNIAMVSPKYISKNKPNFSLAIDENCCFVLDETKNNSLKLINKFGYNPTINTINQYLYQFKKVNLFYNNLSNTNTNTENINLYFKKYYCKFRFDVKLDNNISISEDINKYFEISYLNSLDKISFDSNNNLLILLNRPIKLKLKSGYKSNKDLLTYYKQSVGDISPRYLVKSIENIKDEFIINPDQPTSYIISADLTNTTKFIVTLVNHIGFITDKSTSNEFINLKPKDNSPIGKVYFKIQDEKNISTLDFDKTESIEKVNLSFRKNSISNTLTIDCSGVESNLKIELWK